MRPWAQRQALGGQTDWELGSHRVQSSVRLGWFNDVLQDLESCMANWVLLAACLVLHKQREANSWLYVSSVWCFAAGTKENPSNRSEWLTPQGKVLGHGYLQRLGPSFLSLVPWHNRVDVSPLGMNCSVPCVKVCQYFRNLPTRSHPSVVTRTFRCRYLFRDNSLDMSCSISI